MHLRNSNIGQYNYYNNLNIYALSMHCLSTFVRQEILNISADKYAYSLNIDSYLSEVIVSNSLGLQTIFWVKYVILYYRRYFSHPPWLTKGKLGLKRLTNYGTLFTWIIILNLHKRDKYKFRKERKRFETIIHVSKNDDFLCSNTRAAIRNRNTAATMC